MAQVRITGLDDGEQMAFVRAVSRHFHSDDPDEVLRAYLPVVEVDRSIVARDGDRIVGNFGIDTATISLPGAPPLPCAAVTAVGVSQTHRRQGLLRRMMARGLDQAVDRDEPVAALFASESAIYGRFGFGVTAPTTSYRIDRGYTRMREPVDPRLVTTAGVDEALTGWPAIMDAAVRDRRGGCVSRNHGSWRLAIEVDPPMRRGGASGRRLAHVPGRGYVAYRVKEGSDDVLPSGEVIVLELVAVDAEAEQALWQHVLDIDLTVTVSAGLRPPDDVLPWLLTDRLRTRTSEDAPLYTRLLDVRRALAARSYSTSGSLVLAVHDPDRDQSGTYRLDVGPDGASCEVAGTAPELTLPVDALASLWLGGVRAGQLLAARRLEEHSDGAAVRLGRLFDVELLPWTPFLF